MAETMTLTLAEFLLARFAEDEVRPAHRLLCLATDYDADERPCTCGYPARIKAECEAKRQILAEHVPSGEYDPDSCIACQWDIDCDAPKQNYQRGEGKFPCPTLRFLALPYADHPDFRDEWRV